MLYRPRIGMAAIIGTPAEKPTMKRLGLRAVVIGVSVAGILAARVLADRYEQVTVIEEGHPPFGRRSGSGRAIEALL